MLELAEIGRGIEARERLEGIVDGMAAAGTLRKHDRSRHIRQLEKLGHGSPRQPDVAPEPVAVSVEEARAQLAAFGMGPVA